MSDTNTVKTAINTKYLDLDYYNSEMNDKFSNVRFDWS